MVINKNLIDDGRALPALGMTFNRVVRHEKTYYILVIVSFLLFLVTISTVRITSYPPDAFYYARSLPLSYWAGIAILFTAMLLYLFRKPRGVIKNSAVTEIGIFTVLMLYLFGVTSFIYPSPRFHDVYVVQEMIDTLIRNHFTGLNLGFSESFLEYLYLYSYPGSIIFFSFLDLVTSLSSMTITGYYPIYLMLLLSFFTYIVARRLFPAKALLAPVCMLSLSWTGEYHISPQSFALILYIGFFFFLLLLWNKVREIRLASILMVAAIVISHAITSIALLFNLFFIFLAGTVLRFKACKYNFGIFSIFMMMIIFWLLTSGHRLVFLLSLIFKDMQSRLASADVIVSTITYQASPDYALINKIRIAIVALELLFSLIIILYIMYKRMDREPLLAGVWFISCGLFHVTNIFSEQGILGRFLVFAIFPFSLLVVLAFQRMSKGFMPKLLKASLVAFIVLSAMLIPLSLYGIDHFEFIPEGHLAAEKFQVKANLKPAPASSSPVNATVLSSFESISEADKNNYTGLFLIYQKDLHNMYEVRMSIGSNYLRMFDLQGQNKLYMNGDDRIYYVR